MNKLELNIPENLQMSDFDIKMNLASKLFEEGKISSGQGAVMVGVSKKTFIELLGKYNVSIFGYEANEVMEDIENA